VSENRESNFESQHQRWLKYGLNVVVVSLVVIVLAGLITYLAQRANRRLDTTATGQYSLKPQTLNIIQNLKTPIKIVSLYQKPSPEEAQTTNYAQPVRDLLDEYRREGKNITTDAIDPVANPTKVDDLITEVTNKYGGEVKKYNQVLDSYQGVYKQIEEIAAGEVSKVAKLPVDQLADDEEGQTARAALTTINTIPQLLSSSRESIERRRKQKPPDLKGAVDSVSDSADLISQRAAAIVHIFEQDQGNAKLPESIRTYMASATPTYDKLKKIADDLVKQTKAVGELKLDDLRQSLRARDAILVMGEKDMRVIPFEQVWKADDQQLKQYVPGQELKPKFAGEQQISTAILGLTQSSKPKVCFVRAGGPPLTTPGMPPFQRGGPMSAVAERLKQYNFDVTEKDLTGMWAMQSQMQQMPSEPEPSDEQIKDAIWIVMDFPTSEPQQGMPAPNITQKVEQHLKEGGSALIMVSLHGDAMKDVLGKEWGIDVHPDAVAAHALIKQTEGREGDQIEQAQRIPFIFDIRDYGDDIITRPLKSLQSFLVPLMCIKPTDKAPAGVKVTPIIPIPDHPASWGETDIEGLQNLTNVKYDAATDVKAPIWGGAVAEKQLPPSTQPAGKEKSNVARVARLVVLGTPAVALDQWVNRPDEELLRRGVIANKFPANAELFCNSVYWLAHMEPMIAISPAAMEVARIAPMSDSTLRAWRIGALIVGLPGLVILCGIGVFLARRD
jgi:hypothetical protein